MTKIEITNLDEGIELTKKRIALNIQEALKERLTREHGKDTGDLQSSIIATPVADGIEIQMNITGAYLEFGTPPHMPPVDELKGWVARKFNLTKKEDIDRAAWAVAMHIKRYGTRPFPFIRMTFYQDFIPILKSALKKSFK